MIVLDRLVSVLLRFKVSWNSNSNRNCGERSVRGGLNDADRDT